MPTTYGNDIVYCLKSHCGVRGYCRQKWVLQVQIICKFSNERTCKRNKDVQGLSCGFEVKYRCPENVYIDNDLLAGAYSYYSITARIKGKIFMLLLKFGLLRRKQ